MRLSIIVILLAVAATAGWCADPACYALIHANVIALEKEGVAADQTVIVRNGRIEAIGSTTTQPVPQDAIVIDATGKYLIPGLTDMHVHISEPEDMTPWLANGVTTILNLNGSPTHLQWREALKAGTMEGPNLYTAGPTIYVANTAREGDSLAQTYHDAGYDCLKLYNDITTPAFDAIMANAKRNNMLTVGHMVRAPGYKAVLRSGMAVAHAEEFMYTSFEDSLQLRRIPGVVALTKEAGIPVIATLTAYEAITKQVENLDSVLAQPGLQYIAPWIRESWTADKNRYSVKQGFNAERLERRLTFQDSLIVMMHRAGIPILIGTDCVFNGLLSGHATLKEVEHLVKIGFTPYEALKAATVDAAHFLRADTVFGTITPGKRADLVLLNQNPLDNISAIETRTGVMTRGQWYTANDLQQKLDALPPRFEQMPKEYHEMLTNDISSAIRYSIARDPFGVLLNPEIDKMGDEHRGTEIVRLLSLIHRVAPDYHLAKEIVINELGYRFIGKKQFKEAIAVLKLNAELFPASANTFDSLGEAYLDDGDAVNAKSSYQHALELDPTLDSSKKALEKIK